MSDSTSFIRFRQHYQELLTFLTRKLDSHDQALDVTQETYLRAWSQPSLGLIANPRAYLYKTALNITHDMFRRRKRLPHDSLEEGDIRDLLIAEPTQEAEVEVNQQLERLYEAIQELPPKCRHVFLLHKFKERSQIEIAEQLSISKNMVEKHVMKALAHCKRRMLGGRPRIKGSKPGELKGSNHDDST